MPSWFDVAPRLGVSYDLFGNARTALKATFGRYMAGQTTGFPARYNPLQLQSDTRTWRDTNGDNLAQDSEIGAEQQRRVRSAGADAAARPGHPARIRPRVHRRGAARSHPGPVGERRLLPPRHLQPAPDAEQRLVALRLHHRQRRQPARRVDPAGLQPRPDEARATWTAPTSTRPTPTCAAAPTTASRSGSTRGSAAPSSSAAGRWIGSSMPAATRSRATRRATPARRPSPPTTAPQPDYPLVRPEPARHALAARVQARRVVHAAVGHPGRTSRSRATTGCRCSRAGTSAPTTRYAANCLAPCRPGELVVPNMTLRELRARPGARPVRQYYERQNQLDMGFRKMFRFGKYQAVGAGRHLQHRQLVLREEPEHHVGLVARAAARHPPAAHAAPGGTVPVLELGVRRLGVRS